ncbi:phospho-N-acetylmuramoyl-pentapeptide-transferase [Salisaeta longa]|uniref:phospho-N-acetylmuramoyl-pentapeptide- transferase n=1 Tax=Salisaeta longa TaxID=503170 RepID=UPI0003B70C7D|nr:phospho-N-acetylmuramoyl-pentapeptide-transferase [Salisaeta longa]
MLYFFLKFLERQFEPPGFQVFQFITVRASLAAITALIIALFAGRRIIRWLRAQQLGERVRSGEAAGAVSHAHKAGTPTMGGIIILLSLLGSTALWADLSNTYLWLLWGATAWMGLVGFADDYIKTVRKNKDGLAARYKVWGQVSIGLLVGGVLYFHPDFEAFNALTYMPFLKNRVINYDVFEGWVHGVDLGWVVYLPVAVFIMTAVSNAVNLTDGLDGLTTGVTAFVGLGLTALAYISGNVNFATFLNVMYLPGTGEIAVFGAALVAACFGFLWYNGYPASIFMGDTGALALGAAVGAMTLMVRKELLLPLLGIVYVAEAVSVIMQTSYFKYTRRRTGTGRRIFRMAPLHHHFEAKGTHEAKIVTRFWIVTALTVIAALLTLRIR